MPAHHSEWAHTSVSPWVQGGCQLPCGRAAQALMEVPSCRGKGPPRESEPPTVDVSLPLAREHDQGLHPSGQVLKNRSCTCASSNSASLLGHLSGETLVLESWDRGSHCFIFPLFVGELVPSTPVSPPSNILFPPGHWFSSLPAYRNPTENFNRCLCWVPHPSQFSQLLGDGPGFRRFNASQGILICSQG